MGSRSIFFLRNVKTDNALYINMQVASTSGIIPLAENIAIAIYVTGKEVMVKYINLNFDSIVTGTIDISPNYILIRPDSIISIVTRGLRDKVKNKYIDCKVSVYADVLELDITCKTEFGYEETLHIYSDVDKNLF